MKPLKILMLGPSLTQKGGIATLENHILQYAPPEVSIEHIPSHDEGSIVHRLTIFGRAFSQFLRKLFQQAPDVVHCHLSERGSVLRKLIFTGIAARFNIPVLIHTNGAEFHIFYGSLSTPLQNFISSIFRNDTYFIVLSNRERDLYINSLGLNPEKVFVLPNSVEIPDVLPDRTHTSKISLVFGGRVGQRKGAFDLIQAYGQLPDEQKQVSELILAGDGDLEQGKQLVENLKLTHHVKFLGWINADEMKSLLAKASIFVLPSYNEGLPLALLQAMGWGLPVITTPVAAIPDLITTHENGLLVNPGEIQPLSAAIKLLIENPELRLSLGSKARETVAPLEVKNFWVSLLKIYQGMLASSASPLGE